MNEILKQLETELQDCVNDAQLGDIKSKYLTKTDFMKELQLKVRSATPEDRKIIGQQMNEYKNKVLSLIELKIVDLEKIKIQSKIENEWVDISVEGVDFSNSGQSVLLQIINQSKKIFASIGFDCQDVRGHEFEDVKYNFENLNMPENHPAREMHDTFYVSNNKILRTHCTNISARMLEQMKGEHSSLRILSYGNVYRKDDDDATHSHQFMQMDGFNIGPNINMANLKWTLEYFLKNIFNKDDVTIRLRPSFFPFTEPSVEVDVNCIRCNGKGCSICKHSGWIEVLGAGMLHPNVIKAAGKDPNKIQGYAFGVGVERIAMLKYGIDDIRRFYTNDIRFLKQFNLGDN